MAARMAVRRAALRAAAARLTSGPVGPLSASKASGVAVASRSQEKPYGRAGRSVAGSLVASGLAIGAACRSQSTARCEEDTPRNSSGDEGWEGGEESGYSVNPIQNVTALLRLYDEIDKNMAVLAGRMLEDLERKLEEEKQQQQQQQQQNEEGEEKVKEKDRVALSPEQRALDMSIRFESTLEKVQDAVFRNNHVSKAQVQEALALLARGQLRGSGRAGVVTVAEADAIAEYVRKLGRMRWLCTGSREPLIPTESARMLPDEAPELGVDVVVRVMQELIPALTREMEALVAELRAQSPPLGAAAFHQELSRQYIARSGALTARVCSEREVDVREFQRALLFFHDDPALAQALATLSAAQQKKFRELGLY